MNEHDVECDRPAVGEVTRLLDRLQDSPQVLDRIMALVYDDMRRIAHNQNIGHAASGSRTTELVHEAFLKIFSNNPPELQSRMHLMRMSAMAVRQLIVDRARAHLSHKRGAGAPHLELEEEQVAVEPDEVAHILAVEEALKRLQAHDPELAELIVGSYFGGYTAGELAEMTGQSIRTIQRQLKRARGWLRLEMSG